MPNNANLSIPSNADKSQAITALQTYITELGLHIGPTDLAKPWGAYFYIDPSDIAEFSTLYFPDLPAEQIEEYGNNLQPKFLLVAPGERLSWQYHERRAELWRVIAGPVGAITSDDDTEGPLSELQIGETVHYGALVRHRLTGLDNWGVVAEIWQHTDPANLSDESDIIRVADDYKR